MKTEISRADILDLASYEKVRAEKRDAARMAKADRRAEVGPFATLSFENYDTIWLQIQEMLRIEKGGDGQLADELAAYNPLIPKGRDLAATLMFEIPDPARRDSELRKLGGIEDTITLSFAGHTVTATPDDDTPRTRDDGKTSAVHFLHFRFSDEQSAAFKITGAEITLGFGHPGYRHAAVLSEPVRAALSEDFSSRSGCGEKVVARADRVALASRESDRHLLIHFFISVDPPNLGARQPPGVATGMQPAPIFPASQHLGNDAGLDHRHRHGAGLRVAHHHTHLANDHREAVSRQQILVDPACRPVHVADLPPVIEFGDDFDRPALAHEHPFNGVPGAGSGPDVDFVRPQ